MKGYFENIVMTFFEIRNLYKEFLVVDWGRKASLREVREGRVWV
jgi:hypothetical protein